VRFDEYALSGISVQFTVSGTANYTYQTSGDDPNDIAQNTPIAPSAMTWDTSGTTVVAASATITIAGIPAPRWGRILLNSGTGSVTGTFTQFGNAPY
jgi:uncharacterized Zn-binding protein involved in type VI secretion